MFSASVAIRERRRSLSTSSDTAAVKKPRASGKPARARPAVDPLWFKSAVIYQLHVRSFCDSTGDGVGDFNGLISKLDYLADLGVTALWLQPFYPSPLRDDGYDIADYMDVNPAYGRVEDFRAFVHEAHQAMIHRGVRMLFVTNEDRQLEGIITASDLLGELPQNVNGNAIHVERILLEMVRPDPVQPRRVLPENIHLRFHQNQITPTQAANQTQAALVRPWTLCWPAVSAR